MLDDLLAALSSTRPEPRQARLMPVRLPALAARELRCSVLRLDQIHPVVSGNKAFKLGRNLARAKAEGADTLLSFGGLWSNHLHALAAAGPALGFRTVACVRGDADRALAQSACLRDAQAWGMQLHFLSREHYRQRHDPAFIGTLCQQLGLPAQKVWVIPEGAANREGILGCGDIAELLPDELWQRMDQVLLACGTGATLAGLVTRLDRPVTGIQVLKGEAYLQNEVADLLQREGLQARAHWQVLDGFHRGGYARVDPALLAYCQRMTEQGLPLEPVYSGKLFMAVEALAEQGHFPPQSELLLIHGGGLQGRRGFPALQPEGDFPP